MWMGIKTVKQAWLAESHRKDMVKQRRCLRMAGVVFVTTHPKVDTTQE